MAKKQTRKSISVSRQTYDFVGAKAEAEGVAVSELTTRALRLMFPDLPAQVHASVPAGDPVRHYVIAATPAPPERPTISRATIDALAARRRMIGIAPGTRCANCIDSAATHVGRVDTTDWRGPLCDSCELPDDCKEIARFRP